MAYFKEVEYSSSRRWRQKTAQGRRQLNSCCRSQSIVGVTNLTEDPKLLFIYDFIAVKDCRLRLIPRLWLGLGPWD